MFGFKTCKISHLTFLHSVGVKSRSKSFTTKCNIENNSPAKQCCYRKIQIPSMDMISPIGK